MGQFTVMVVDIIYSRELFGAAIGMTKNVQDAKDLIQEACLKAISSESKFNGGNLYGWVYIILRNCFINGCRVKARQKTFYIGDLNKINYSLIDPEVYIKEEKEGEERMVKRMRNNVSLLDKKQSQAISLLLDGNKYKKISMLMNEPEGTIKSRIFKGKKQLKNMYSDVLKDTKI